MVPERRRGFDHDTGRPIPPEVPDHSWKSINKTPPNLLPSPEEPPPPDVPPPEVDFPEVDFSLGERGRYAERYQQGATVTLLKQDPWQVMDSWDDEVVISELKGLGPKGKLVYQFRQQGKDIIGLGKEGVDFCCQLLMHQGQVIRELEMDYTLMGEGTEQVALFKAKAGRFAVGSGGEMALDVVIATKRQPLYQARRDTGELVLNPHWYEQGSTKALRNARLRLLPIAIREYVISLAQQTGRVERGGDRRAGSTELASEAQRGLYASLLKSHHLKEEERAKALAWLEKKDIKRQDMAQQITAVQNLIATRSEDEKQRLSGGYE